MSTLIRSLIARDSVLYSGSLALGVAAAFVMAAWGAPPESVWADLVSAESELVLVMQPANCGINARSIQRVNAFAESSPIPVRGVFTGNPAESEKERVAAMFAFEIPITFEEAGEWSRAAQLSGFSGQVALLVKKGRVERVVPVQDWEQLLPHSIIMGG